MSTQREVRLPRELVDIVVSNLDKKDLATCTTLSRYWNASALPQLFAESTLQPSYQTPFRSIERFPEFLHSHSKLARYIKSLTISSIEFNVAELDPLLGQLPSLEAFTLHNSGLTPCSHGERLRGWSFPRNLRSLSFVETSFDFRDSDAPDFYNTLDVQGKSFVEVLNLFGLVQTLVLKGLYFSWEIEEEADKRRDDKRLAACISDTFHCVQLTSFSATDHLRILGMSRSLASLQELVMDDAGGRDREFLGVVGHSLTSLSLYVNPRPQTIERWDALSCCTALLELHIQMNASLDYYPENYRASFGSVISHVPPTVIRIVIEITYHYSHLQPPHKTPSVTINPCINQ